MLRLVRGSYLGIMVIFFSGHQLPRALNSVVENDSTRVDEGRNCCNILAIKMKALTVVGRVEQSLIGATIRDIICSPQPVSGCEPTATYSTKEIVLRCLC